MSTFAGSSQYGLGYRKGAKYALDYIDDELYESDEVDTKAYKVFADAKLAVHKYLLDQAEKEDA